MPRPETDITKTGETVFTEPATGTATPALPAIDGRQVVGRVKVSASAPTVNDDSTQGYKSGLRWITTSTPIRSYVCIDASVGAAVWKQVSNLQGNATGSNPTTSNDNTQNYEVGSVWINTTTLRTFIATDVSTGAAVWRTTVPGYGGHPGRMNFSATADPTVSNDNTQEYSVGSIWVNLNASPRKSFTCVNATTGAAVWIETTNTASSPDSPGLYFLGSILDYSVAAGLTAGEIQYSRIYLVAGLTLAGVQVFVDSGGSAARHLRGGLYSQTDPTSIIGTPITRVAQSNEVGTGGADGTYYTIPFTSSYTVTTTGYYWAAIVADSASVKIITTAVVYRENFPPTRRESTTGTTLPATTGTLTNPTSAIALVAAVE